MRGYRQGTKKKDGTWQIAVVGFDLLKGKKRKRYFTGKTQKDAQDRMLAAMPEENWIAPERDEYRKLRSKAVSPCQSAVYFIWTPDDPSPKVKIGYATYPRNRLMEMQTGSPCRLEILHLTKGRVPRERELQALFGHLRTHGEWFSLTEDVREWIAQDPDAVRLL